MPHRICGALLVAIGCFVSSQASACESSIKTFQSIIDSDLQTGNVHPKVHASMSDRIKAIASTCEAGRSGEAQSQLQSLKRQNGYR